MIVLPGDIGNSHGALSAQCSIENNYLWPSRDSEGGNAIKINLPSRRKSNQISLQMDGRRGFWWAGPLNPFSNFPFLSLSRALQPLVSGGVGLPHPQPDQGDAQHGGGLHRLQLRGLRLRHHKDRRGMWVLVVVHCRQPLHYINEVRLKTSYKTKSWKSWSLLVWPDRTHQHLL